MMSKQHGRVVRVGLETTYFPPLGRVVEFLEAITAEKTGALGGEFIFQRDPARREEIADLTEFSLPGIYGEDLGIV